MQAFVVLLTWEIDIFFQLYPSFCLKLISCYIKTFFVTLKIILNVSQSKIIFVGQAMISHAWLPIIQTLSVISP